MFKKIAVSLALFAGVIFGQQSCPTGTVPVTSAGSTVIANTPSYGLCLNTTTGQIASNYAVSTSVTASACGGLATLALGTKTVSTTCAISATDLILITRRSSNSSTTVGVLGIGTITNGTSFVINAYTAGTASTVATGDLSIVSWLIVHTF